MPRAAGLAKALRRSQVLLLPDARGGALVDELALLLVEQRLLLRVHGAEVGVYGETSASILGAQVQAGEEHGYGGGERLTPE